MIERTNPEALWLSLPPATRHALGCYLMELAAAAYLDERVGEEEALGALPAVYAKANEGAGQSIIETIMAGLVGAIPRSTFEGTDGRPLVPAVLGPLCRECGCHECSACVTINAAGEPEPCAWAEPDLCTACRDKLPRMSADAPQLVVPIRTSLEPGDRLSRGGIIIPGGEI